MTDETSDIGRKQLQTALAKVKGQEDRVTAAYIDEVMDLQRYRSEMESLRQRREDLENSIEELYQRQQQEQDSRSALEHLESFCHELSQGLDALNFDERQQLLRLVVESVTVDNGHITVQTVIPTSQSNLRNVRPELVEGSSR